MQLGAALIASFMILVVFGVLDRPLQQMKMKKGWTLLLFVALLAGNSYPITLFQELTINPAGILLLLYTAIRAMRARAFSFLWGLALSVPCGVAIWLMQRLNLGTEPGLICGLISGAMAAALIHKPHGALFAAAFAPIIAQAIAGILELVELGYTCVEVGAGIYFDTAIVGAALVFTLFALHTLRVRRPKPAQR